MSSPFERGWPTGETVIAMVVFGALAFFSLPSLPSRHLESLIPGTCGRSGVTQSLSNMRLLQLATEAMAADGITNGNTNLGWPGDTGRSFAYWATMLVQENYVGTNDLCKLLSAPGKTIPSHPFPAANTNGIIVYAAGKETPEDTVFLSTANFTNSPNGGFKLLANAKPYGDKVFAVLRKSGEGSILYGKQVGQTKLIGGYVPLCQ